MSLPLLGLAACGLVILWLVWILATAPQKDEE
jgi:hypothetical protein